MQKRAVQTSQNVNETASRVWNPDQISNLFWFEMRFLLKDSCHHNLMFTQNPNFLIWFAFCSALEKINCINPPQHWLSPYNRPLTWRPLLTTTSPPFTPSVLQSIARWFNIVPLGHRFPISLSLLVSGKPNLNSKSREERLSQTEKIKTKLGQQKPS